VPTSFWEVPVADLRGARVALLMESDYYEPEIFYYQRRFAEEEVRLDLVTRLWGQPEITFTGHEYRAPLTVTQGLEEIGDKELRSYDAIIVPSGMVSDRLRYSEKPLDLSPATELMKRAFAVPEVLKGVICHGMWLLAKVPETVRGRPVTCHNNLVGDVINMGAEYRDEDVVVDGDLVTGRSGAHAHLFARALLAELAARRAA
jgi:protease I